MKKISLSLFALLFSFLIVEAQCPEIDCPPSITADAISGTCGAEIEYGIPFGTNPCGEGAEEITVTYNYTGSPQSFVVPQNVTEISFQMAGGQGGYAYKEGQLSEGLHSPGNGGIINGTLPVTPGETLWIYVGSQGLSGSEGSGGAGGFNGGGNGMSNGENSGGGGGGASDIRNTNGELFEVYVSAGGGGGASWNFPTGDDGGDGGGPIGTNGSSNGDNTGILGGQAAGIDAPGAGGIFEGFASGEDGVGGQGGDAGLNTAGGGGGGGYFGGGGGTWSGGGGGSSHSELASDMTFETGGQEGHGFVALTYSPGGPTTTNLTAGFDSGEVFPVGITEVEWTATDELGNTATCTFNVEILDIDAPSIICPGDISQPTDPGFCTSEVEYAPMEVVDLCQDSYWEVLEGPLSGEAFDLGSTDVTLIAFDDSGNSTTCEFNVFVEDEQSPGIVCPDDIVVFANDLDCSTVVEYEAPFGALNCSGTLANSTAFEFTGEQQSWIVPEGVEQIEVVMAGARGGLSSEDETIIEDHIPGYGGVVTATIEVTEGETIYIEVGGLGTNGAFNSGGSGGYNGGGNGATSGGFSGGGGGGASDIRIGGTTLEDRVLVAGGGGGCASNYPEGDNGGSGGGIIAGNGMSNFIDDDESVGWGGTDLAGGQGGQLEDFGAGEDGLLGEGGNGGPDTSGGGGGGGLYGGGGGSWAGGGGGSSFYGEATDVEELEGENEGNGYVIFYYSSIEITTSQLSGIGSGNEFPVGTTTETYQAMDELGNSVVCSFDVTVEASFSEVTQTGNTLTADFEGLTYQWLDCDDNFNPIPGATEMSFEVIENGSYALEVNNGSCTDTSACFTVNPTYIVQLNHWSDNISVYPNPAEDQVFIQLAEPLGSYTYELYNLNGQLLFSEKIMNDPQHAIDITSLESGMYVLKIATGHESLSVRLVKQ